MSEMRPYEIDGSGVKEISRPRELKETILPEMLCNISDKGSTARRKTKPSRQDTDTQQQWPFPTTLLTKIGKPLKFNPSNHEEATF